MAIVCGRTQCVALDDFGTVWEINAKTVKDNEISASIQFTSPLKEIASLSCGAHFTICVGISGDVWSFGDNSNGQLGVPLPHQIIPEPQQVKGIPPIVLSVCGDYHVICLSSDSSIWGFGKNIFGQLGLGHSRDQDIPVKLEPDNIIHVACGSEHTIVMDSNNKIKGCGRNQVGQLGIQGRLQVRKYFCDIPALEDIATFSCSNDYSMFLSNEGHVFCFGNFLYGNTGEKRKRIPSLPRIKALSCAYKHVMLLDYEENIWSLGSNSNGELGQGNYAAHSTPLKIKITCPATLSQGGYCSIIKDDNNSVWICGLSYGFLPTRGSTPVLTVLPEEFSHRVGTSFVARVRVKSARK